MASAVASVRIRDWIVSTPSFGSDESRAFTPYV